MTALPLVLCYHKVERRGELGVTRISPRRFARQIERLAHDGWRTIGAAELLACARGRRAPGARELAITFDDAYRGLRDHAFPVLRAHGFGAVCGVITDYAGKLNRWDVAYGGRRFAHLAWRDMERWRHDGIEFVAHTATHPRLTWLDARDVRRELATSRRALRDALGVDTRTISYPFGAAGPRERAIARDEGFELGLALGGRWSGDALAVPRVPVYLWSMPRPGRGRLASLEMAVGTVANRCAVGTTILQRIGAPG